MAAIHIEIVSVAPPYQAAQIKVSRFPLGSDTPKIKGIVTRILDAAAKDGLASDVFLQNEFFNNGRQQFDAHVAEWQPESGLGVWPDRPPPEVWKTTDMFRMARGERVPLMYRVYRLGGGVKANAQALDLLLGSGMVMTVVHSGTIDKLLSYYKDTFLPTIKQENLRILPFYVPLLDTKSLHTSHDGDLSKWLGPGHLYLRESPGDNAILIVTDSDLNALLERAGAKRGGDNRWSIE